MRFFSFRRRAFLQNFLISMGILLGIFLVLFAILVIFSGRYMVYSRSGVQADIDWAENMQATTERKTVDVVPTVTVLPKTAINTGTVRRLSGCYISADRLSNLEALKKEIAAGAFGTVIVEMKDIYGYFYYKTTMGVPTASGISTDSVASFLKGLKDEGYYLVAAIPAFADQSYCLNHVELGLPLKSGALWVDDNNCYWMDPKNEGTLSFLETIALELSNLGFRELLLNDFYFPLSDSIVYPETEMTKAEVLDRTVQRLQADLGGAITLSFGLGNSNTFPSHLENGRIYLNAIHDGNAVLSTVSQLSLCVENPEIQLVFITGSEDERFDSYGHILPLKEAETLPEE